MKGTEGILRLRYRRRQSGRTYIANQFYQLPLQVLPPYYEETDGTAFTYILNPTGGVLQNDRLTVDITVEKGARALVTTPSAGKFYRMEDGHGELTNSFEVASGAVLEYLPEYNIPYADTKIIQENLFRVSKDSILIAADMI
ncbi:MAG: urease accessory protein UreD, partial [Eubacteriales bacterium]|nr:urease accessory protein UreD [Eubacteriales bacterium]